MVLAVLSVLVVLATANARLAWNLKREVAGLEHRQMLRWQALAATNAPAPPPVPAP